MPARTKEEPKKKHDELQENMTNLVWFNFNIY